MVPKTIFQFDDLLQELVELRKAVILPIMANYSERIPITVSNDERHIGWPWLVWVSGLSAGLQTKGSLVRFPVRGCAWVVGKVRRSGAGGGGARERQPIDFSLSFCLPSPLAKNK